MTKEKKAKPWVKDLLVAFAGTTLSIILTFGTSALINHVNRNRDRKLTALMVLSSTDKTIENIFSSNTDIWKNVGNFQFIDNIGKTYAALREFEQDWKYQMLGISEEYTRIIDHPDYYPGTTLPEKILSNSNVRNHLEAIGENREWLRYVAFAMREANRHSMDLIGISEEEVMAFTDERTHPGEASAEEAANEAFFRGDFAIPAISLDSLSTMQNEIRLLDSLRNAGK